MIMILCLSRNWNYLRTGHMSLSFGLTSGIMCHFWYNYLDRLHPGRGLKTIAKKVLTDQVLFSPVCIAACLLMSAILKGADFEQKSTWRGACHKGLQLYIAEWLLWPPGKNHIVILRFVQLPLILQFQLNSSTFTSSTQDIGYFTIIWFL